MSNTEAPYIVTIELAVWSWTLKDAQEKAKEITDATLKIANPPYLRSVELKMNSEYNPFVFKLTDLT